jgi:serine/threonine-protein kinase RsbW
MPESRVTIPARLDQIEAVCDLVGSSASKAGFTESDAYRCQLAAGEACENIILHGYKKESAGNIQVAVEVEPGEITIVLCDQAPAFNPAEYPPVQEWTLEDPPIGGLGLVIIHKVMDEVNYRRKEGKNCLRMKKFARANSHQ